MSEHASETPQAKLLHQATSWVAMAYFFLIPLLFVPAFAANVFDFPKWVFTVAASGILLALWGVDSFLHKRIVLPSRIPALAISLFIASILVSMLLTPSNKIASLQGKGGLLLALGLMMFVLIPLLKEKGKAVVYALIAGSFFVSWLEIISYFGLLSSFISDPIFKAMTFTPLGSQSAVISFLVVVTVMTVMVALKQKEVLNKVLLFVVTGIQAIALVLAVTQVLPGQPAQPHFLPLSSGWSIAVDQLKNPKTALLGVGPDNFASAFSRFRPSSLNQTDEWFFRFGASSNEVFTLLTTMGVIGLVAFGFFLLTLLKSMWGLRTESLELKAAAAGLGLTIVQLFLIPANFSVLLLLFGLGAVVVAATHTKDTVIEQPVVSVVTAIVCVIAPLTLFYFAYRMVMAESAFGQSLVFAAANKGTDTYNAQIKAISFNPYVYRYRVAYSNTNLALANSLASRKDLSDEDKKKITQLVAQSIREAKAAVALEPQNSASWTNLANIYRQLINFAQGADRWAITTYIQAIRLDSTNPQLRIDFGGLLLSLKLYEDAIIQYKQAIALKPDFANAYYNLSFAYKQLKQYPQAFAAMQNVVSLIGSDGQEADKAKQELEELRKLVPEAAQTATAAAARAKDAQLSRPNPTPSPKPAGQVQFNPQEQEELKPPTVESVTEAPETSPTPSPSASPSPSPAASTSPDPSASAGPSPAP